MGRQDAEILENIVVPTIYADDIARVEVHGFRTRIVYIEYKQINGVWVRSPVLEMIRPTNSVGSSMVMRLVHDALHRERQAAPILGAVHH